MILLAPHCFVAALLKTSPGATTNGQRRSRRDDYDEGSTTVLLRDYPWYVVPARLHKMRAPGQYRKATLIELGLAGTWWTFDCGWQPAAPGSPRAGLWTFGMIYSHRLPTAASPPGRPGRKQLGELRHKLVMMCCPPPQKNNRPGCSQQEE